MWRQSAVYRAGDEQPGRNVALKVIAPGAPRTAAFASASFASPAWRPHSTTPTSSPSTKQVTRMANSSWPCVMWKGPTSHGCWPTRARWTRDGPLHCYRRSPKRLDAAHEKSLIHRDVKPSNISVATAAGEEHRYLADFGLTKRTGSLSGRHRARATSVPGTLEYVAPEQITGGELDERSDVYSLGCVLYEVSPASHRFLEPLTSPSCGRTCTRSLEPAVQLRPELPRESSIRCSPVRLRNSRPPLPLCRRAGRRCPLGARPRRSAACRASPALAVRHRRSRRSCAGRDRSRRSSSRSAPGSGGLSAISPNAVGVIDPETNKLVAEVPVGIRPGPVAVGEGSVWVANRDDGDRQSA